MVNRNLHDTPHAHAYRLILTLMLADVSALLARTFVPTDHGLTSHCVNLIIAAPRNTVAVYAIAF